MQKQTSTLSLHSIIHLIENAINMTVLRHENLFAYAAIFQEYYRLFENLRFYFEFRSLTVEVRIDICDY